MSSVTAERRHAPAAGRQARVGRDVGWYGAVVLLGATLIVVAAINQPFNQNELAQMKPYGGTSLSEITSGTRQPPLDPLLGSLVQHLLGEGQLRQRLVPVLAGIATLVLMALLVRRLRLGLAGPFVMALMATAPLMVRFSAYTRPYALPVFLMMLFVFAAERWLDGSGRRWLGVTALAAVALPLARVPEPTVFLLTTAATMAWLAFRGRFSWSQAGPLFAVAAAALALVGYPMFSSLASEAPGFWDPSPRGVIGRLGSGVHEVTTGLLSLLASWFPWWPLTLVVLVAAVAVSDSRRRLCQWWFVWPLLAGPVGFVLAYHFLSPVSFDVLPYRSRAAYFFIPAYVLLVCALVSALVDTQTLSRRVRGGLGVVVAAALISQLPLTARVISQGDSPDFAAVGGLIETRVPDDAVVLYDRPSMVGPWHMNFLAKSRYLEDPQAVIDVGALIRTPELIPDDAAVYLLVNGQCTAAGCSSGPLVWAEPVPGWHLVSVFDRFTLYAPSSGRTGRPGAIAAMNALGGALGPALGYRETFAAAALQRLDGRPREGLRTIRRMYSAAGPELAADIRHEARLKGLDPL